MQRKHEDIPALCSLWVCAVRPVQGFMRFNLQCLDNLHMMIQSVQTEKHEVLFTMLSMDTCTDTSPNMLQ